MSPRTGPEFMLRALLLGLLAAGLVAVAVHGVPLDEIRGAGRRLQGWAAGHPVAAPLAIFVVYTGLAGLTLPVNIPFALLSGGLFGFVEGSVIVSFASSCGATLSFLSSRHLFRDLVRRRFGRRLAAIEALLARDGMIGLLMLRLVPAVPYTVTNLVFGLTAVPVLRFHLVGQLGMLPATMVYVNAGTRLDRLDSLSGLFSSGLLAALLMLVGLPLFAGMAMRRWRRG